jgi:NAD(P)-dependent dehydrogenase (short-subunit alcohol dehydrogenase family)
MTRPDTFELSGKVAVVTGALGLLGRHHCEALASAGAAVIVTDLNESACNDFAGELRGRGHHAIGVGADITDRAAVERLRERSRELTGSIDVLVNNAAQNEKVEAPALALEASRFESYALESFRSALDVGVLGAFLCSQILGTVMAEQRSGSIINVASTYGIVAPDQALYRGSDGEQLFYKSPAYPTAKGALIAFTRYLAAYWGSADVRVNALCPGGVENGQSDFFVASYGRRTPLGRMAQPDEYQGALVFLASAASAYMTGATLVVDGGFTAW